MKIPWLGDYKRKKLFLQEGKLSPYMRANHAGPCSQINTEKDFLVEIFNYENTFDSKHIVSSHRFVQEQCTDGILY